MPQPEAARFAFGHRLRDLRRQAALTQRQLAERVGIDFTYLSKLENGRGDPPAEETITRIAKELGCEPEELLALAGKIPAGLRKRAAEDQQFALLLRKMPKIPDKVLKGWYRQAGIDNPDKKR